MKKRLFAILLVLTLALSLLPVAVFAEGEDAAAGDAQQEQQQAQEQQEQEQPEEPPEAQPADEEQPDNSAPDADKPELPAVQSANQDIAVQAEHTHCICGGSVTAGDHASHSDTAYTAWNGTSGITYNNNTAYVYLTGNATLSSDLIVDGKTLHLCLNGKTLSSNSEKKIKVRNNARLVLCDCQGGGTIKGATKNVWGGGCVYLYTSTLDMFGGKLTGGKVTKGGGGGAIAMDDQQCIFNMYGGEISGNDGNNYGGAIFRKFDANKPNTTGGAFNMYGGTIKNNTAKNGGAFFSTTGGSINLTGGTISGNKATMSSNNAGGGAIYMRGCGTITISGSTEITGNSSSLDGGAILMGWGTITISGSARLTGNTASRWGGAICLRTDANKTSVLNMTGGEISGNKAAEGGAVEVLDANCTFNLSGGKIINNSSSGDGGAIYLNQEPSVLNMTGGEISGNTAAGNGGGVYIYRSGSVCELSNGTISGNKASGSGGGIYISPKNSGKLNISGTPVVKDNTVSDKANNVYLPSGKTVIISGAISSGASIGVTTGNTNYPVVFSNAYDADYSGYFFSDAGKEILYNSSNQLEIGEDNAHTCADTNRDHKCDACGKVLSECADTNNDHKCDVCDKVLSQCADNNNDHKCDTCGKVISTHTGGTATCTEKAVCSTCNQPYGDVNANNHNWGAWKSNGNDTHTHICSRSVSHTETKNCSGGTPTCTAKAVCTTCGGEYGSVQGHDWGEPSYTWTSVPDGYMCAAYKKCNHCNEDVSELAAVSYAVTQAPTCLNEGTGTYTATFSGAFGFPAQAKDVVLSATGHKWGEVTYTWAKNESGGYTCTAKRVCKNDGTHIETANAAVTYGVVTPAACENAGSGKYTATFTVDWAETQTKDVVLPALGHDYSAWASNGDNTHTRVCSHDKTHIEAGKCSGGAASCHAKAVCEVCKAEYGELNSANHDGGTELRNARAATYTSTGYTGDTYCKGCSAKLSSGTVIPKLSSGAPAPSKPAASGKTVQSGKTGDAGVAIYAGMTILSLTGCAWLRRKSK